MMDLINHLNNYNFRPTSKPVPETEKKRTIKKDEGGGKSSKKTLGLTKPKGDKPAASGTSTAAAGPSAASEKRPSEMSAGSTPPPHAKRLRTVRIPVLYN